MDLHLCVAVAHNDLGWLAVVSQVLHNTDVVVAALSFCGELDRIRHMPLAWPAAFAPAHASAHTPMDPSQPQTLSQRAKLAFTLHKLPIRRKLAIPLTSIRLSCPGALPLCSCLPAHSPRSWLELTSSFMYATVSKKNGEAASP